MTIIEVVLIGAGVLFIASALDNTPIVQTFQKIISGQPINWSGSTPTTSTGTTPNVPPGTLPLPGLGL